MAMITFFMCLAYRLKRSYVRDRDSQSMSAGKYEVTTEKKTGRTERERQNKNKVDLNHQVILRVLCDISGRKIFFFFEYVPSCKMSQLETLSQRDIKSVDTSQQNIRHESFYERFTISPSSDILFILSADGLLLRRSQESIRQIRFCCFCHKPSADSP